MTFPALGNYAMYWEQDQWIGECWFPVQIVDAPSDDEMYPGERIALLWDVFVPYAEREIDDALFIPIDGEIDDNTFAQAIHCGRIARAGLPEKANFRMEQKDWVGIVGSNA